ncbi:aminodeoxychorismate lyase [Thioalkalicoccus limnaeus]|uniref:Aminodeoxychorismate lyase n=1 Tax=Thioalkalicoccus limnaeus TaxID=120681 RepID=A0ABV4BAF1_9GAMM
MVGAPLRTWVDGVPDDRVSVFDRGLHYGDGLFETFRVQHGRPCLWRDHRRRLALGAQRLGLPDLDTDRLLAEVRALSADRPLAVVKLLVTRGDGGRGYRPSRDARPRRILSLYPWPDHPPAWSAQGVDVILCQTSVSEQPRLAGIKHLNRLEQVLARDEWDDPAIAEGLMADADGRLVGGTMSNLFLVLGDRLVTPSLDRAGVAGTVRAAVIREAPALGYVIVERGVELADLFAADGAFLTNALIGCWSIRRVGGRDLGQAPLLVALASSIRRLAATPD